MLFVEIFSSSTAWLRWIVRNALTSAACLLVSLTNTIIQGGTENPSFRRSFITYRSTSYNCANAYEYCDGLLERRSALGVAEYACDLAGYEMDDGRLVSHFLHDSRHTQTRNSCYRRETARCRCRVTPAAAYEPIHNTYRKSTAASRGFPAIANISCLCCRRSCNEAVA